MVDWWTGELMDLWNRGADASKADDVKAGRVGRRGRVGIFQ